MKAFKQTRVLDMFKRILIPTDGSRLSKKAIAQGVGLAAATGAAVIGFHVRPRYPIIAFTEGAAVPQEYFDDWERDTKLAATKFLRDVEQAAKAAGVEYKGAQGGQQTASDGIIATAKRLKCDLIVMGAHGRRGLARLLLGSETNRVLVYSKVPVLVIR